MTALYILQNSRWDDTELRYSLRGLNAYTNVSDVIIVGDKPKVKLKGVEFLACKNQSDQSYFKDANIAHKIMYAAPFLPEVFLYIHDDHFLTAPLNTIPYASEWPKNRTDMYGQTIANTRPHVGQIPFFDIHCPQLMMRDHLVAAINSVDWTVKAGYCMKTLYAKQAGISQMQWCTDLKIDDDQLQWHQLMNMVQGRAWFSLHDRMRTRAVKEMLETLYPNRSIWEV